MSGGLTFDIAHLLAGGLVLVSFMMLYQDRLFALINVFALHAIVLALSVAWQAYVQDAHHLTSQRPSPSFQGDRRSVGHRIIQRLGIHRDIKTAVGIGQQCSWNRSGGPVHGPDAAGHSRCRPLAREDLAFALSLSCSGCW